MLGRTDDGSVLGSAVAIFRARRRSLAHGSKGSGRTPWLWRTRAGRCGALADIGRDGSLRDCQPYSPLSYLPTRQTIEELTRMCSKRYCRNRSLIYQVSYNDNANIYRLYVSSCRYHVNHDDDNNVTLIMRIIIMHTCAVYITVHRLSDRL